METSNQYLIGNRLSWVLQHCKRLSGHAKKFVFYLITYYRRSVTNEHHCMDNGRTDRRGSLNSILDEVDLKALVLIRNLCTSLGRT